MDKQAPIPDDLRVTRARETLAGSIPASPRDVLAAANPTGSVLTTETDIATKREFLWNVHSYINNYIQFADTKAGFCVGIASALMAALFASKSHELFVRGPQSQYSGHWSILAGVSLSAFVLLALSIGAAVMVVRPRAWVYSEKGFIFWNDISNFDKASSFAAQYGAQTDDELTLCLSQHLYSLAKVCRRKYLWVSVATLAAVGGGALAVIVLLFKR